jgi:cytochrome P450 family 135
LTAAAPPGPDANVLAQTVAFHRDPLDFLLRQREQFGDVFQLRLLTARPTFVVTDPGAVESLLDADPERAHAGAARRAVLPFASTRSAFGGDGDSHRSARARLAPAFSPEAIDSRREGIARIAERHASRWPLGRPFRLLARVRTLCDEIFVRLVLGVRDDEIAEQLIDAVGRMLRTPGNPPVTLPGKGDGLIGEVGHALFEQKQAPVLAALSRAVEARRAEDSGEAGDEVDVLGCMVASEAGLTTEQIVDELVSLLMAAQEPPSIGLGWILDRLSREPRLADEFLADPRSRRSDAIVRETLRLRPPASGSLRRLLAPMQVDGHQLPAGAGVLAPTSLVHRDPRGFRDPDRFEPERWLADITPSWPFFPFGGGARRCVGEPLARAEIEVAVPAVLRTVKLSPLSPEPERMVQRATVLVPQRSLLVRASRA